MKRAGAPLTGVPGALRAAGRAPFGTAGSGLTGAPSGGRAVLLLARACAWALLVAGWIGIGSFALRFASSVPAGFALVALWLLALGVAATVATRGGLRSRARALGLCTCTVAACSGLWATPRGGGLAALVAALLAWAALTALASGVVRGLRLGQAASPTPPVAAAGLGAGVAGLVLGDPADLQGLALRLGIFLCAVCAVLLWLQRGLGEPAAPRAGCRAGLFDCSLPAWPAGAWRDAGQWPILLAGLVMLPTMAALPLMADACRAAGLSASALVLTHLGAMFLPPWLLQNRFARLRPHRLAASCAALLGVGAAGILWAPAPIGALLAAICHGAAWGLAWGGQLWAPARRAQQGSSPLRAASGYALLTLGFGLVVHMSGANGAQWAHVVLGAAGLVAWCLHQAWRLASGAEAPGAVRNSES